MEYKSWLKINQGINLIKFDVILVCQIKNMKQIITSFFLFILFNQLFGAQNKYALLIGINQYQIKDKSGKTVLDPANALNGCVNDAVSMKELLISKFDFNNENITTLYNTNASKKNILKQIDILLSRCKNGDVAVVYYAGHGMPFRYGENDQEIAEVILPSNAFAAVPFSYIQQTELAIKFNLFVDKNVTLTAIFDCCFSLGTDRNGPIMTHQKQSPTDTLIFNLENSKEVSTFKDPIEPTDANEYELLTEEEDSSETEIINDENSVANKNQELTTNRGITMKQYREMTKNVFPYGFKKVDTTYNPPSQRDNSQFIFFSATNDMQTAPEMRDENGKSHGAFTNALLKVFETNPATISFKEALNKTVKQLKVFGKEITPSARYKPKQREEKNIFGIKSGDLKLKVYLPSESSTFKDLNSIYKKWVKPLNDGKSKNLKINQSNSLCSKVYILNKGKNVFYIDGKTKKRYTISNIDTLKRYIKDQAYFIYLPVPKVIIENIKMECLKNNKIELVDDINKADVSIYCANHSPKNDGFIDSVKDIGQNITDGFIEYDYKEKLSFVGSNETVGLKRKKPGHSFPKEELIVPASDVVENISKKFASWFNLKAGK